MAMNLWVLQDAGNFTTNWVTMTARTLLHKVSHNCCSNCAFE